MNKSLSGFSWLVIPLAFILFTAPGAISYVFFHPDEKYYTDAALQMIEKNDFLRPVKLTAARVSISPL
jgi:4-amino-4-deoxy-L-arabinose transferase-like glycosyltransferase